MASETKPKLDKEIVLKLLAEADTKWYTHHESEATGRYKYREHLEFTADYIVKNYEKAKSQKARERGKKEK